MTPTTSRSTVSACELDLATVEPSIAGPKRPQDRIPLAAAAHAVRSLLAGASQSVRPRRPGSTRPLSDSFPASDPIAIDHDRETDRPRRVSSGCRSTATTGRRIRCR